MRYLTGTVRDGSGTAVAGVSIVAVPVYPGMTVSSDGGVTFALLVPPYPSVLTASDGTWRLHLWTESECHFGPLGYRLDITGPLQLSYTGLVPDGTPDLVLDTLVSGGTWSEVADLGSQQLSPAPQGRQGNTGAPGLNWRNAWSATTQYIQGDAVSFSGTLYVCGSAGALGVAQEPGTSFWTAVGSTAVTDATPTTPGSVLIRTAASGAHPVGLTSDDLNIHSGVPQLDSAGLLLSGQIPQLMNANIAAGAAIAESKLALASDAVATTASRRTLGTGAQQAAAGNDSRLSDQRTPLDASVTDAKVVSVALSKLLQSGATNGQVPTYNSGTGLWAPATPGALSVNKYSSGMSNQGVGLTLSGIQYALANPKLPKTWSGIHLCNPLANDASATIGELNISGPHSAAGTLRGSGSVFTPFYYSWGRDGGSVPQNVFTLRANSTAYSVTSIVANGTTWVVTATGHNLLVNSVASIAGFTGSNGPTGYNIANVQVTAVTTNTFTIANATSPGAITNYTGVTTFKTWGENGDWWIRNHPNYCLYADTAGTQPNPFGYALNQRIACLDMTNASLQALLIGWFNTLLSSPYDFDGIYFDNGMVADYHNTALYTYSGAAGTFPGTSGSYALKWAAPNSNSFVTGWLAAQQAAFNAIYAAVKDANPGKVILMNNSIMGSTGLLTSDWLSARDVSWDILHQEPGFVNNSASALPNVNITALTANGTTWSGTTDGSHGWSAGNTVVISGASVAAWNGTYTLATASGGAFTITNSATPAAFTGTAGISAWPSFSLSIPFMTNGGGLSQLTTPFYQIMSYFQTMQKAGKGLAVFQQVPYRGVYHGDLLSPASASSIPTNWTSDGTVSATVQGNRKVWMDWALATYLMAKAHHTYLWMNTNQTYQVVIPNQTEYTTAQSIGEPTSDFYALPAYTYVFDNGSGGAGSGTPYIYARDYTGGMVIVVADGQVYSQSNPANATNRYQVDVTQLGPTPGAYKDLWGNSVTSTTFPLHVPGNNPGGTWLRAAAVLLS